MSYKEDSQFIRKAVTLIVTKDDAAAVCDVHIPLVESIFDMWNREPKNGFKEIAVGRDVPRREPLATPSDCTTCAALVFQENRES